MEKNKIKNKLNEKPKTQKEQIQRLEEMILLLLEKIEELENKVGSNE
jgi:hypothetical protein